MPFTTTKTHQFLIGGFGGYITVSLDDNGVPGEISLVSYDKENSTLCGALKVCATAISLVLQQGVPLKNICKMFVGVQFEPSGWTNNKRIPRAESVVDYIFRWLASEFLPYSDQVELGIANTETTPQTEDVYHPARVGAPSCPDCGLIMARSGPDYKCLGCGTILRP